MQTLDYIRNNQKLRTILERNFDLNILDFLEQPENLNGRLSWSMQGQTFALRGDGSQYILLVDGTVGFWSVDGNVGRIADNIEDFFTLLINCEDWLWFSMRPAGSDEMWYLDSTLLSSFIEARMNALCSSIDTELEGIKRWVCNELNISLCSNLNPILHHFYLSTYRTPPLTALYREDDGTLSCSSGLIVELFEDASTSLKETNEKDLDSKPTKTEAKTLAEKYGLAPPEG